ncbi:MAG: pantoate--beta-alanine ligase [Candidatus Omnitrophota bacterium]
MKIIRDPRQMQQTLRAARSAKKTVGFVPTMGALHKGHLSLIRRCAKDNDISVVSIFINPSQFGPKEDLKKYPRPIKNDIALCRKEGVDFIFYPSARAMYPEGFKTHVCVEELSSLLCGDSRPGHFRGVTTVVAKLFNIINPDQVYFGQKDAQQAAIIKRMAADLNFSVKITVMPIVREASGLALSSRNTYLDARQKQDALVLSASLKLAKKMADSGIKDTGKILSAMRRLIKGKRTIRMDYATAVDPVNLKHVKRITGECLIALAAWIGKTRLIDNILICPKN